MHQISAPASAIQASGNFWQIWPYPYQNFGLDLADFNTATVHICYLHLKVIKLVFAYQNMSDLTHSQ